MINISKKIIAVILSMVVLFVTFFVATIGVSAEDDNLERVTCGELEDYPDNSQLFAGYLDKLMYPDRQISFYSTYAESALSGVTLDMYHLLKTRVENIAEVGGSTKINLGEELVINFESSAYTSTGLKAEAKSVWAEEVSLSLLLEALLYDIPYELYWFDKTKGISCGYSISAKNGVGKIYNITFYFEVEKEYRSGEYNVDSEIANAAHNVPIKAMSIVDKYVGYTDYEKLEAYKNEVCALTDYNYDVDENTAYGDPWQIIYVFDENPETKVVCEGYSKAFEFLCDLTDFCSPIECYMVSGYMGTANSLGGHMWNIVRIDNYDYLVDITNSDDGAIGENGELFLRGNSSSYLLNGGYYSYKLYNRNYYYMYDDNTLEYYSQEDWSVLWLAKKDFDITTPLHTYNLQVTSDKFLKETSTDNDQLIYYYSCPCGEHGTETFAISSSIEEVSDTNGDGENNILDIIFEKKRISEYGNYDYHFDINHDSVVNSMDIIKLLSYILSFAFNK